MSFSFDRIKAMKLVDVLILAVATHFCGISLAEARDCDRIVFGDKDSEQAHGFRDDGASRVIDGACLRQARRIVCPEPAQWRSAPIKFSLAVNPSADNYLTVELWGGDTTHDHLFATIDGKMLWQMHLGEGQT